MCSRIARSHTSTLSSRRFKSAPEFGTYAFTTTHDPRAPSSTRDPPRRTLPRPSSSPRSTLAHRLARTPRHHCTLSSPSSSRTRAARTRLKTSRRRAAAPSTPSFVSWSTKTSAFARDATSSSARGFFLSNERRPFTFQETIVSAGVDDDDDDDDANDDDAARSSMTTRDGRARTRDRATRAGSSAPWTSPS